MSSGTVITLAVVLIGLKLAVSWLEPRMAFFPIAGIQETPAALGVEYRDVRIPTADGETLHAWWLEHPSPRAAVIFWHGNGGNLSLWLDVIAELRRRGCSVLAVDYRGYGASTGRPSEKGLYRDADASVSLFFERLHNQKVPAIYWGRSIGATVAAYAASRRPPDALVLESPMPNARSILKTNPVLWLLSFLSSYRFPTSRYVQRYDGPLLIVHGDADSIIPYSAGQRVFADAKSRDKTLLTVRGADHNDLHIVSPPLYWEGIDAFIRRLRAGGV